MHPGKNPLRKLVNLVPRFNSQLRQGLHPIAHTPQGARHRRDGIDIPAALDHKSQHLVKPAFQVNVFLTVLTRSKKKRGQWSILTERDLGLTSRHQITRTLGRFHQRQVADEQAVEAIAKFRIHAEGQQMVATVVI